MSAAINTAHSVCRLVDIEDGTARGFEIGEGVAAQHLFIIRQGTDIYAYRNSCPHAGVNLDWQPDQFLDSSAQYIQCAMHGAMFRIEDGLCVSGPCAGDALAAIPAYLQDGEIVCELPPASLAP